jgi:hypothetical protein
MAAQVKWHFSGHYFECCNRSVVCPSLISKAPRSTAGLSGMGPSRNDDISAEPCRQSPGPHGFDEFVCGLALMFHIDEGSYGDLALDGLNVALAIHTPGPVAEGNWAVGAYIDQDADDEQTEALGAIFTGAAGGPMAVFAPLIAKNLGVKKVPITYKLEGKKPSPEILAILHMSADPLPTMHPSGEMWANSGHPVSPDQLSFAVTAPASTFNDPGMRWDNSGRNGHYAPIHWSNG